jgi:hypothetical protein
MSLDPLTAVMNVGKELIERIWPDPNQRAEQLFKLEELKQHGDIDRLNAHVNLMLGQLKVNAKEAEHKSLFVSGWRPAVGWVCVAILAFNYIGVYCLELAAQFFDGVLVPVPMDMSELYPVMLGMLGIGGMRSHDKKHNVATHSIK